MQFTSSRRGFLVGAGTLAALGAASGCFGSFGATTSLWKFNKGVSDNKWLQWLVFLGLVILPVYELFTLGDVLVFNTVEFFTGKNPIGSALLDLGHGRTLALSRDAQDPHVVRAEIRASRHDAAAPEVCVYFIQQTDTGFVVMDSGHRVVSRVTSERGLIELFSAEGERLLALDDADASSLADAVARGSSPSAMVEAHARRSGSDRAIARAAGPAVF
jgi:hypothetical protein